MPAWSTPCHTYARVQSSWRARRRTALARQGSQGPLAARLRGADRARWTPTVRTGWSVVATGVAELVVGALARSRLPEVVAAWEPGHHDVFICLPLTVASGRRIVAATLVG